MAEQGSGRETKRIPSDQLDEYFARFTKNFLLRESTNTIDIEVLGADSGDQFEAEGSGIFGITYDPRANTLEFELAGGDHRVSKPREVWVEEEADGFITALEVVRDDGTREVARMKRGAIAPPSFGTHASDSPPEIRP